MQKIIDDFCIGPLNVSTERRYLAPKIGGLGLIKVSDFLVSQHCMWVKRTAQSTRDNWRIHLLELCNGNAFTLSPAAVSEIEHLVIHGIARSFQTFTLNHSYIGQNSKKALIFNNPIFERGPKDKGILDKKFFGDGKPGKANLNNIANLKYVECWEGNNFLTMERLNENFTLVINAATYFRLRGALLYFRTKTKDSGTDPGESISDFFGSFKKGSKSCHRILSKAHIIKNRILPKNLTIVTMFF